MLLNGPICKTPILRNEEKDGNNPGLYCYDAELQCGNQKKAFPLGTL